MAEANIQASSANTAPASTNNDLSGLTKLLIAGSLASGAAHGFYNFHGIPLDEKLKWGLILGPSALGMANNVILNGIRKARAFAKGSSYESSIVLGINGTAMEGIVGTGALNLVGYGAGYLMGYLAKYI